MSTSRRAVTRPSISPLVWVAASVWAGIALGAESFLNRAALSAGPATLPTTAVILTCVATLLLLAATALTPRWTKTGSLLIAGLCLGAVLGGVTVAALSEAATTADGLSGEWVASLAADPRRVPGGLRLELELQSEPLAGERIICNWKTSGANLASAPHLYERISFRGRLEPSSDPEWFARDIRRGVVARGEVWTLEREGWSSGPNGWIGRMRAAILERTGTIKGPGAALLDGMLLGYRERVRGTATEIDMRSTGLAHLLAVSGTHFAIVLGTFAFAARGLGAGRRGVTWIGLVAGGVFVLLSGGQVSAIRAYGVAVLAGVSTLGNRRRDPVASLAVVVLIFLVADPVSAFSLGFQLSVTAVAALTTVGPLVTEWLAEALGRRLRILAAPVGVTLTATAATAPLIAETFGTLPLIGVVANVACVPLATLGLVLGVGGALLTSIAPPGGDVLFAASAWVLDRVAHIAGHLGSLIGWNLPMEATPAIVVLVAVGFATLWAIWPRPASRCHARTVTVTLACALCFPLFGLPASGAEIIFLDVGQGDAILIRDGANSMLVDTGPDARVLRHALARNGVRRLDAAIITHGHDDHYGGSEALHGLVSRDAVFGSAVMERPTGERVLEAPVPLKRGDTLTVGRFRAEVLWPPAGLRPDEENAASVVLLVSLGEFEVLLTGDAEEPVYSSIARHGDLTKTDVLKSPHHGSAGGVSEGNLAALAPKLCVISVGEGNRHGHPAPSTLSTYLVQGIRVVRTDRHGDVVVRISKGGESFVLSRGDPH